MAMSRTRKIVLIITGIVLVIFFFVVLGIALLFAAFRHSEPAIADNSVLVLRVSGSLPDYVPENPVRKIFGSDDQSLTSLLMQLKKAKVDRRIRAVLLDIDMPGGGWAKADEIRDAIADFRSSGKPIYAYMELGLNREYYIATACDRIYIPPVGDLFINGLAAEAMFFRGSLDKLGIQADVFQIGKYKNAPDMLTGKKSSTAHPKESNTIWNNNSDPYASSVP